MIFPMESFRKKPYIHGVTTMEEFFEDQHNRRRFLRKYSPKVFPKLKKCKNESCDNYHDNKDSYCSFECRVFWETTMRASRYGGQDVINHNMRCDTCLYGYEHKSKIKAFKYHCVEDTATSHGIKEVLVNPDHWCHFYKEKHS